MISGGSEVSLEKIRVFTVDQEQLRGISGRKLEGKSVKNHSKKLMEGLKQLSLR